MYSSYMQGGMNSAISPDERTKPDDSKTLLFVPDTPLGLELWASEVGHTLPTSSFTKISLNWVAPCNPIKFHVIRT